MDTTTIISNNPRGCAGGRMTETLKRYQQAIGAALDGQRSGVLTHSETLARIDALSLTYHAEQATIYREAGI